MKTTTTATKNNGGNSDGYNNNRSSLAKERWKVNGRRKGERQDAVIATAWDTFARVGTWTLDNLCLCVSVWLFVCWKADADDERAL